MARTMRLHLVAATWLLVNAVAGIGCSRGVGVEPADDAVVMPRPSDGGVERDEVVGHWFNIGKGYCYEQQLWLSFGVNGEFTLTRVQHDTCGTDPSGWGSYQGWYQNHAELMLEFAYALEEGGSYHRLTTAICAFAYRSRIHSYCRGLSEAVKPGVLSGVYIARHRGVIALVEPVQGGCGAGL